MIGGLPCKTLLQLIQEILLDFASRNVAQAMSTKLWYQATTAATVLTSYRNNAIIQDK